MQAVIVSLLVASFAWNVLQIQSSPVATFYSPLTRVWELLTGAMLALSHANIKHRIDRPKLQNLQSVIGFLLIFCAIYLLSKDKRFPGWWALLPTLGSYLIISSGSNAWLNRVVLSNQLMVWIGLISYPLYLWHWPLLAFLRSTEIDAPSPIMLWLTIGLSFALAGLSYILIERPLRFGRWWRGKTRLKMAMLAMTIVGVALGGYASYTHNGYSSRFPPPLRNLLDYQYDYGESNGACMVGIGGNQSQLEPYCYTKKNTFKKSVALWGDSYTWHLAAALNKRGLEAQHGQIGFNLIASAGCAPILNVDAPYCQKGNHFVLDTLLHQQFDTIVLAANWTNDFQPELAATLQKLHDLQTSKQLATKDIFLIGPAPTWHHGLFKTVINAAIKDTPEYRLPSRLNTGFIADFALDTKMRALAQRHEVTYISLLDILCNAEGCMTKLSDEPDALISYDHGHLSLLGAQYVVSHFPPKLFE